MRTDRGTGPASVSIAEEPTASIPHPVPRADVGGPAVKRRSSILDIILGNGG
jgi:penicillin-binding protein 1A